MVRGVYCLESEITTEKINSLNRCLEARQGDFLVLPLPDTISSGDDGEDDMGSTQHYCLRWNNYQSNMTSVFHNLLRTQAFVDVTLACNDQSLKAHKVVLSACSSYFQKLLLENPCKHPTIIMPQDVCFTDLKFIIEFVYKGEIDVSQAELQSLLKTADQLKIKGLCEVEDGKEGAEVTPLPPTPRRRLGHKHSRFGGGKRPIYRQRMNNDSRDGIGECMDIGDDGCEFDDEEEYDEDEEPKEIPVVVVQQSPPAPPEDVIMGPQQPSAATAAILHHQQQSLAVGHDSQQIGCEAVVREGEVAMGTEPSPPAATLVTAVQTPEATHRDIAVDSRDLVEEENKVKFETLRAIDQSEQMKMETHITDRTVQTIDEEDDPAMHTMMITPELLGLIPSSQSDCSDVCSTSTVKSNYSTICTGLNGTNKSWTQEDMNQALQALRHQTMSLSKASATYGIPSTTLWQRAHRLGIDTPKKEGQTKSWTEHSLNTALEALRTGQISANKASKAYGIPSSTLYKIARREGIRLAAPFNAAPTAWVPEDLERALDAIRSGQCTVQRAAAEYGIPSGTLYGRCKREGIELSRNNPTPWSEEAMMDALDAVRIGQMSINQAAIHYNLPYSSLYGRFKRGKYESLCGNTEVTTTHQQQQQQSQQTQNSQQQQTPQQQQQQHSAPSSNQSTQQELESQQQQQNERSNQQQQQSTAAQTPTQSAQQQQQQQPPPPPPPQSQQQQQQQHSPPSNSAQQPQIMLVQYQQPLHVYQPATAT
ncbi:hypothetical protein O3M35_011179 [Rhynocoris fuscipes]|uniref:Uncharacterized protein n=1 Tax=Rhynocoris fuscipes TaxID=488301 RepID=A0AAW1CVA9_9HEMI